MKKNLTILEIFKEIIAETERPTCASYEYDATPTERERLNNIYHLCKDALRELEID